MNLDKVRDLYNNNIEEFGIDARSVGWTTRERQYLRFEKLCEIIDPSEGLIINELGVGYGEFFKYLIANNIQVDKFIGYDISQKMLDAAHDYLPFDNVQLVCDSEISTVADYTFTSGIFNVMFDSNEKEWEHYVKRVLTDMFENSKKGIAFNLLTDFVDFKAPNLYYADPLKYFEFCRKELSRHVTLIHDYKLYEWTILVKRNNQ